MLKRIIEKLIEHCIGLSYLAVLLFPGMYIVIGACTHPQELINWGYYDPPLMVGIFWAVGIGSFVHPFVLTTLNLLFLFWRNKKEEFQAKGRQVRKVVLAEVSLFSFSWGWMGISELDAFTKGILFNLYYYRFPLAVVVGMVGILLIQIAVYCNLEWAEEEKIREGKLLWKKAGVCLGIVLSVIWLVLFFENNIASFYANLFSINYILMAGKLLWGKREKRDENRAKIG